MKNIKIKGFHDLELNAYLYEPKSEAKAIIQIIHGMQEHGARYNDFANFLMENGYIVLVSDLRGHGSSLLGENKYGYGEADFYNEVVEDQKIIAAYLKDTYNLPLYIFGHSFGSFVTQKLAQVLHIADKFIIAGTTDGDKFLYKLGNSVASLYVSFGKSDDLATSIENLSINSLGKKYENGNWLTRDPKVFEAYKADPLCGRSFPVSFYKSMFSNLTHLNQGIKNIPKTAKLFLIAGTADPVGSCGKYVSSLYNKYAKAGVNVKIKLYPDARHELINETNKDEVYKDILEFYES